MKLEEISPIWVITDETIQSKKGDISFVYKVEFPEVYLLSAEDYDLFNSVFTKAVNMFSTGTIVSRYDFVYPESHRSEPDLKSFIDRSNCRFWGERPFMQSESYFVFTKTARIEKKSYYNTTLNSKAGLFEKSQYDLEEISLFKIDIENFIEAIINTSTHQLKKVKFSQLITFNELYEFVFERFLYMGIDGIRKNLSVEFNDQDDNATVGDNLVTVLSMNSNGYPPELFSSIVDGDVEVPGISELEVSTLHKVGFKLDFPHIIVNAIYTLDQKGEKERLAGAIKTFQSLSGSMYNNEMKHSIEDFLGAVTSEPTLKVVEHHFGLIITTPEYQKELHNKRLSRACSTLAEMDVRYTKNLFNSLNSLFSYCPGNTNDIAQCDRGVVLTQHAACFNIWENNQKTSGKGVKFIDRKFHTPLMVDLWDYPGIENRNMFVCAPSGKGKSFTINHILSYLLLDKLDMVIVDVGNSYKKHGQLNQAIYIEATEKDPLVYNPFLSIPKDEKGIYQTRSNTEEDSDILTPIITILYRAWKGDKDSGMTPSEYAVFSKILGKYYEFLSENPEVKPCYDTFHPFLLLEFKKEHQNKVRLFDIESYEIVMQMFVKGGQFGRLFNVDVNPDYFKNQLVIFELGGIESNKILFEVTYTLIMQVVMDKMMSQNKRKMYLFMDEVWKILNSSMEGFIRFMYKTARKHDGGIGVITQEISDILKSGVGEAIISNSDLKILLQHGLEKVDQLAQELKLTNHQIALLKSVKITTSLREIFIKAGSDIAMVYGIEVGPEAQKAFTSKKTDNYVIYEELERTGNMELSIKNLVELDHPGQYINPTSHIKN